MNKCKNCIHFPCLRNECNINNGWCEYGKLISTFMCEIIDNFDYIASETNKIKSELERE